MSLIAQIEKFYLLYDGETVAVKMSTFSFF